MPPSCLSFFTTKARRDAPISNSTHSSAATLISEVKTSKNLEPAAGKSVDTTERLKELRRLTKEQGLDYYVVPTDDAHQSEYVATTDRRREFISGFSGSAGQAIIGVENAYLLTDSRYWLQAEEQLDDNWQLVKVRSPGLPSNWIEWLPTTARKSRIGIDARTLSYSDAVSLDSKLKKVGSALFYPETNLVDAIWSDKPSRSQEPIYLHPIEFTGEHARDKLRRLRQWIQGQSLEDEERPVAALISSLSEIAYLLNLRGSDIAYNPEFFSYLYVGLNSATLFVDSVKVPEEVASYLTDLGVDWKEYEGIWEFLGKSERGSSGKDIISPQTSYAISRALGSNFIVLPSQVDEMKSIKNDVEIEGFRKAYLRDGVCFTKFLAWLDTEIRLGHKYTEWDAAEKLTELRKKVEFNKGLAYENISSTGANAALPHYGPTKDTAKVIEKDTPYLNDSGGQYLDGTCDTTRTVHFGKPTEEQMEAYTRVLQGHIALDSVIFPEGTTGLQLDVLARKKLWRDGLNYLHGTGHGFGQFLNVHEGPQGFGIHVPFRIGHVVTNEPGYYEAGKFGVRIESALAVKRVKTKGNFNGDVWLGFERLTCVPVDVRMVKKKLMTKTERVWLKEHNETCLEKLSPLLKDDQVATAWLKRQAKDAKKLL
ncbi:putative aminopeptidase cytoplasmic [Moniliophthora roreri MCA 2997]|uniref:Aminopeptidase cytoplasmic n=1 Tax=Moniliophthora roreri (strain MCA 2997) TaxID=1381753 RepID=V2X9Z1_MONRO|nr:putative aminopeptidase cytoplasmic [Moniliophthora roreri MCA 2997]